MKEIHDKYVSTMWLSHVWHMWSTNKNENINKLVTKLVPKDTYLCQTITAETRIHMAIAIDSVGYEEFFSRLFPKLGMEYSNTIVKHQHCMMDYEQYNRQQYQNQPHVLQRSAAAHSLKMKNEILKTYNNEKKGLAYKSNIAGPETTTTIHMQDNNTVEMNTDNTKNSEEENTFVNPFDADNGGFVNTDFACFKFLWQTQNTGCDENVSGGASGDKLKTDSTEMTENGMCVKFV